MKRRSYRQYCALAKALDVVGERWTLLMVRELMIGPRRYRELLENLPGMGTNLLAARLKELETQGLIERVPIEESSRTKGYALTTRGQELEQAIRGLIQWGVDLLGAPKEDDLSRPEWDLVAFRMLFRPELAVKVEGYYVIRAGELELFIQVEARKVALLDRLPRGVLETVIEGPGALLRAVILGELSSEEALASGQIQIKGSKRQAKRFLACFRHPTD